MDKIIETQQVELCFMLDSNASSVLQSRWNTFVMHCHGMLFSVDVNKWLSFCRLESNRNIPPLECSEGGIGGNDKQTNRQIRFKQRYGTVDENKKTIAMVVSSTKEEKWTFKELEDLVYAFCRYANEIVHETCVNGIIQICSVG